MNEATSESTGTTVCDECGAEANVHVSNMVDGQPTVRHLCGHCVDALADWQRTRRQDFSAASVLIAVGGFVLLLSLLADYFRFGIHSGFGFVQLEGVFLGVILVLLGAVAKARSVLIIGCAVTTLSLLADWLAFGQAPGFGIQQKLGCAVGLGIISVGIWVSVRRH